MAHQVFSNDVLRVVVMVQGWYHVAAVEINTPTGWQPVVRGIAGQEFATSVASAGATSFVVARDMERGWTLRLSATTDAWEATETIALAPGQSVLRREQSYHFTRACDAAIYPGWRLADDGRTRYTFALRAHEAQLGRVPPLRADVAWALPFPFHVWHGDQWVALYGVDRHVSAGTLDFMPPGSDGLARLSIYYPDTTEQPAGFDELPRLPQLAHFEPGDEVTLLDILAVQPLSPGQEPLLEAERLAAELLLDRPWPPRELQAVADGIADFYNHCDLWEPEAFGPGRGWFLNMWTYTNGGTPQRKGPGAGYFDLGWGEGIAAEIVVALVRHWRRTGRADLLRYVDEMTLSMDRFKRGDGDAKPFYDRSTGERFGDFMLDHTPPGHRIWTHSLGHTGSQLLQAYTAASNYPNPESRQAWLAVAQSIGAFFAQHQKDDGDVHDIFDENDGELNVKPNRIPARAVVCGLWARLAQVTGDATYVARALRLAHAVAPEIRAYAFYNQMIDGLAAPGVEFMDGEAAYYALEGLAPLYDVTRDPEVLASCQRAAAFGIAWTYFFDVPHAHRGISRGGQCCRMPDFPLLYPIGPAKAVEPLLSLSQSTGDAFYARMAHEMVRFIGEYQLDCPGKPWHGGMIHAIDQSSGKHWGPDKCGQVDTGMATGNSLAAIEQWLYHTGLKPV